MNTKRILVVEDDADLRELLTLLLESQGFAVEPAANGREALVRVGQRMPDLILLDMKMPVMDGWAFAAQFRREHDHLAPIVAMTAADHAALRAAEIGAEAWLAKPFEPDELFSTVRARLAPP